MSIDFRELPDLAVRTLGGAVVYANDEAFAARENLISAGPSVFDPSSFGHKGKVYDGWETRRRREAGHDEAIVRLGAAGVVKGVVIDTSWFKGNYPPEASVDGLCLDGHPSVDELVGHEGWQPLVPPQAIKGDAENPFEVVGDAATRRYTHVRLRIHPDGGVARLRVHGQAIADPSVVDALGVVDLAAAENGATMIDSSNRFYGSSTNLLLPGPVRSMGEGWETARRRDDGNDWVHVALAAEGHVRVAELDTSYFLHNAPGWASLRGRRAGGEWFELLARTALQPDTRHRFVLGDTPAADEVRLDIHPDGGMARLRLFGSLTDEGRAELGRRW
ncbi:allantoicase [Pseudonocardia spinosispora]|uniref:allantoicase n=1 Tax=Pseudonocardia spinosispora TaxID=103441 RepID=UPI0003FD8977|nr:allantoicase [Pseudonocardia spinosispora]